MSFKRLIKESLSKLEKGGYQDEELAATIVTIILGSVGDTSFSSSETLQQLSRNPECMVLALRSAYGIENPVKNSILLAERHRQQYRSRDVTPKKEMLNLKELLCLVGINADFSINEFNNLENLIAFIKKQLSFGKKTFVACDRYNYHPAHITHVLYVEEEKLSGSSPDQDFFLDLLGKMTLSRNCKVIVFVEE